jgi:hypothetical protein
MNLSLLTYIEYIIIAMFRENKGGFNENDILVAKVIDLVKKIHFYSRVSS